MNGISRPRRAGFIGGVTGVYTPLSACGSIDRLLANGREYAFI